MTLARTLAAGCLACWMTGAHAEVVVDQSFVYPGGFTGYAYLTNSSYPNAFRRAQSFTVGVEGYLNTIKVFHGGVEVIDGINILDSLAGGGHIVGTSTLLVQEDLTTTFDVRHLNIGARAGQMLAFEVFGGQGVAAAGYHVAVAVPERYAGGSDWYHYPETGFVSNDSDAYFISTMDRALLPVPEPAHYAMLAAGLGILTGAARRAQGRHAS